MALLDHAASRHAGQRSGGAYLTAALILLAIGVTGQFDRLMALIPKGIASGMMAGILLPFGLNAFKSIGSLPLLSCGMIAAYLVFKRLLPRYCIVLLLLTGALLAWASGHTHFGGITLELAMPRFIAPTWSWAGTFSLALPLVLTTLTGQYLPGMAVLRGAGYDSPVRPSSRPAVWPRWPWPARGITIAIAAITAAMCTGRDAHDDPARRYIAGVANGLFYLFAGLCGGSLVMLFAALPRELVATLAGLPCWRHHRQPRRHGGGRRPPRSVRHHLPCDRLGMSFRPRFGLLGHFDRHAGLLALMPGGGRPRALLTHIPHFLTTPARPSGRAAGLPQPNNTQETCIMRHIDVHELSDKARFNRFHAGTAVVRLIIIFDGYDLAVAGIALPSIMKEMGVTAQNAGFMVSSALFGMMFGAIFRHHRRPIGRRWAIAICIALFSVFTAAAGLTTTRHLQRHALPGRPRHRRRDAQRGGADDRVLAAQNAPPGHPDVQRLRGGRHAGGVARQGSDRNLRLVLRVPGRPARAADPRILKSLPESMPFLIREGRLDELKQIVARLEPSIVPMRATASPCPAGTAPRAPHRQTVPGWARLQHRDVLDCLLHVPVHGVCAQLLAHQADGQRRLQPRLRPDLRAGAQLRRR
jgi:hypothetical protein